MPEEEKLDWYVVHTYSGYENKVMDSLRKTVENRNLQDKIDRVEVPVEEVIQIKDGKRHTVQRKLFPSSRSTRKTRSSRSPCRSLAATPSWTSTTRARARSWTRTNRRKNHAPLKHANRRPPH